MESALIFGNFPDLLPEIDSSLAEAGFTVAHVSQQTQFLAALRDATPDLILIEARNSAFSGLLKAAIRQASGATIYVIDAGTVFCRYPFQSRSDNVVAALRTAGVKVSDRLIANPIPKRLATQNTAGATDKFLI